MALWATAVMKQSLVPWNSWWTVILASSVTVVETFILNTALWRLGRLVSADNYFMLFPQHCRPCPTTATVAQLRIHRNSTWQHRVTWQQHQHRQDYYGNHQNTVTYCCRIYEFYNLLRLFGLWFSILPSYRQEKNTYEQHMTWWMFVLMNGWSSPTDVA